MVDISRARLTKLRADLVRDQATHLANLNGVNGAIQAIDLLLTPEPETVAAAPESTDAVGV